MPRVPPNGEFIYLSSNSFSGLNNGNSVVNATVGLPMRSLGNYPADHVRPKEHCDWLRVPEEWSGAHRGTTVPPWSSLWSRTLVRLSCPGTVGNPQGRVPVSHPHPEPPKSGV